MNLQKITKELFPFLSSGLFVGSGKDKNKELDNDIIFSTTKSLTTEITAQMGNAMEGGETKTALWTLALLLFLISLLFIFLIHMLSRKKPEDAGSKASAKKSIFSKNTESSETEIYCADVKDSDSQVTGKQEQLVQNVVTD